MGAGSLRIAFPNVFLPPMTTIHAAVVLVTSGFFACSGGSSQPPGPPVQPPGPQPASLPLAGVHLHMRVGEVFNGVVAHFDVTAKAKYDAAIGWGDGRWSGGTLRAGHDRFAGVVDHPERHGDIHRPGYRGRFQ